MASRVNGFKPNGSKRFDTLVTTFSRPQYRIPDNKRLRTGWRNLREFIKIDHSDPQAKIIIDNKLMDEVGGLLNYLT